MNLDDILSQPLAPVRDDGFSVRLVLKLRRAEEKRRLLLWGAVALALAPPALVLPLPAAGGFVATTLVHAALSPAFGYAAGALVLLWALKPARHRA